LSVQLVAAKFDHGTRIVEESLQAQGTFACSVRQRSVGHSLLDGDTTLSSKSSELAKAYLGGEAAPELVHSVSFARQHVNRSGAGVLTVRSPANKQHKN
jgi:hypothetical protein